MSANIIILISAAKLRPRLRLLYPSENLPLLPLTKMGLDASWIWRNDTARALNKPLSEWKIKPRTVALWLNSDSLLDSCSEIEATQLAWNDGVGNVLLAKAIPSLRTSLEKCIKLLNVYHISLSNVSAGIALATTAMPGCTVSTMLTEVFQSLEGALLLVSAGHLSTVPVYVVLLAQ